MNKRHPVTGLKRTQVYLTERSRQILDLDNDHLARDANGRAIRVLTDRVDGILSSYSAVVQEFMPELSADDWAKRFDQMRDSKLPDAESDPITVAVLDAFARFESFDAGMPLHERLQLAGCKLLDESSES